jgi:type II secretory pathway component PulK
MLLRKHNPVPCAASERGSALVITLWVALILSVIALDLAYSTRLEMRTGAYHAEHVQARELARAGLERALAHMAVADNRQFQSALRLEDNSWTPAQTTGPAVWAENIIEDADRAPAGMLAVEIVNESGKLDINAVDRPTLERLLLLLGFEAPEQFAGAILALRDSRPDAAFLCLDELLNIPGVDTTMIYGEDMNNNGLLDIAENDGEQSEPPDNRDGALDTGLAAHVTTSPHGAISVNHATAPVLAAVLDISMEQAQQIADLRKARDFHITDLADLANLDWMNETAAETISSRLSLDADRFTVRIKAAATDGNAPMQADVAVAVIEGTPEPVLWRAY